MLVNQQRGLVIALALLAGAVAVAAAVVAPGSSSVIQHVDDAVFRWAKAAEFGPAVAAAKAMSFLGSTVVNWPVRVGAAMLLVVRRRWLQLAAFALAVASSEALIGPLKSAFDRARPPSSLIATTGASFPSGHAIAGAVTAVGLVVVLLPPGRRRFAWEVRAIAFAFLMALSRVYLRAHWLSDVVGGGLLGGGLALGWPALLQSLRDRHVAQRQRSGVPGGST